MIGIFPIAGRVTVDTCPPTPYNSNVARQKAGFYQRVRPRHRAGKDLPGTARGGWEQNRRQSHRGRAAPLRRSISWRKTAPASS
ncbi:hypothetical protein GCM10010844_42110 [Deinococcus radiotolerans]|uniref:Uncharacterized protein n=1 Tax=Deinococcus radiotolerans TaxID=1309407 RepID=A0ABQ2FR50_9DEIO|nr:hypothetical protein GCM10010844_42110 [Deinococcus radiotolerans]